MSNKIFNDMHLEAKNLLDDIETGRLGLPDMQRPFVWTDSKVRDLLDSMLSCFHITFGQINGAMYSGR